MKGVVTVVIAVVVTVGTLFVAVIVVVDSCIGYLPLFLLLSTLQLVVPAFVTLLPNRSAGVVASSKGKVQCLSRS